jgi:plastocyanin
LNLRVRRALVLAAVLVAFLVPVPSAQAATQTIQINSGSPSPNPANINPGDKVKWHNNDDVPHVIHIGSDEILVPEDGGDSELAGPFDAGTYPYTVKDGTDTVGSGQIVAEEPATTTTQAPTTTKPSTTTTGSTTTSTSSTTTTSSSTTTTTRPISSFSGPVSVNDGGKSGGSSALPLILGGLVVVAALAGLAYWLWWRSGEPYDEDDGPDWTQEPPPTVQGPRI